MKEIKEMYQAADWKQEKHAPVIHLPAFSPGTAMAITVNIGEEITHPNTTEHHIAWMEVYFLPEGGKFPYLLGRYSFDSHGASAQGPNTSTVYAEPYVTVKLKTEVAGTIMANSYCNIHGLWSSSAELK